MIIPIGHDQSIRRYPWVTIALIAACTLIQIWATVGAPSDDEIAQLESEIYSATTEEESDAVVRRAEQLLDRIPAWRFGYRTGTVEDDEEEDLSSGLSYRLITSAFIHEGWLHLIGNMLFLWLVGSALEDRWGRLRFAVFYAIGAAAATYAFVLTYSGPLTTLVGASGAVSAAMGAFLVYFHRTDITLWYFIMYRTGTFRLAAYVALPLWLGDQVLMASLDRSVDGVSSIAYAAHIGGFVFGFAVALIAKLIWPGQPRSDDDDDDAPADRVVAERPAARDLGREQKLVEAIAKKDLAATRTLGSRVLIDLGRGEDHERVTDLYRAIARAGFRTMPLTDGAFVAAATAADQLRDLPLYVEIAGAMRSEHPGSALLPKVLYRLSELHARLGDEAAELELLKLLAERYGRHEYGAKAARELAKRSV
ncbi:MAG: rhomboid family intramembrane serine protease [Myxococcales bacterium]|nr:rhomboid family intramembrane serine protease [Myxococcales bacterium]